LLKRLWALGVVGVLAGTIAYGTGRFPVYAATGPALEDAAPDAASVAGAKVFQANCAACHGENRQGHPPMFPSLVGVGTRLTTPQITTIIHNGKGVMPPFAKIADPDLSNLIHYLTSDKPAAPATPATAPPAAEHAAAGPGAGIYQQNCAFCHGRDLGGGDSGPDLTRSKLVADDVNGDKISYVVANGRPENKMPKFTLTSVEMTDLVGYIHATVKIASMKKGGRRGVDVADLQTGNVDAGKAYFDGPGGCKGCHSPSGDLAGVASRYQGLQLEERMLYPRDVKDTVTVTLPSGETVKGSLEYQDEFTLGLRDATGTYRSWPATAIKYKIDSPVSAHVDQFPKYTDDDIHNLMAYIQTMK
jgi:mono/diheme cytochrome c family protein